MKFNDKISRQRAFELTMGSTGTGRADISTRLSAANAPAVMVQARVPLATQDIY